METMDYLGHERASIGMRLGRIEVKMDGCELKLFFRPLSVFILKRM